MTPTPIPEPGPDEEQPSGSEPPAPLPGASWSELPAGLDGQALVDGLVSSGLLNGKEEDQEAEFAEWQAAEQEGRLEPPTDPARVAAIAVEHMVPGPAQAGWLGVAAAGRDRLDENELTGVVIASRQLASWVQACELGAAGQLAQRTAVADRKIGLRADGRPRRVSRDAVGQIEQALKLTHYAAEEMSDLAITLTWRLPATGAALAAGHIDLDRAELIVGATAVLSEELARRVEERVLPDAGRWTRPQLRERLAYAVIAVDPDGAEQRRQGAERHAEMRLYADDDQTATLMMTKQPQIEAAASFARVTALARARIAAGMPGTLNFHRSQVALGLLMGTLPPIPPAEDAPPDQPPPNDPGNDPDPGSGPGSGCDADPAAGGDPGAACTGDSGLADDGLWDDLPAPRDEDAPPDDGLDDEAEGSDQSWDPAEEDADLYGTGPVPEWPALGAIPPTLARRVPSRPADGRPVPGLLDALLPWTTLAGLAERPGMLGRIGPVTAAQARSLAHAAEHDPAAQWRVIVTNPAGQAIAVARVRRPRRQRRDGPGSGREGAGSARDGPAPGGGLVGRITVTITEDTLGQQLRGPRRRPPGIAAATVRAAARALDRVRAQESANEAAGGCAHVGASPAYRPPPRLRELVTARDVTCRNPVCRQPAWRSDLDHTRPWAPEGQGGPTCSCNLGGGCRRDHQLKQDQRWRLEQNRPGWFTWTTPAGRKYEVGPDIYPV